MLDTVVWLISIKPI